MNGKDFNEVVSLILKEDSRFDRSAYFFLREALDYTVKKERPAHRTGVSRHVDGRVLSRGIRDYALEQYGPMASTLLAQWGVLKTSDFGAIVYNLVDYNVNTGGGRRILMTSSIFLRRSKSRFFLPAGSRLLRPRSALRKTRDR